MLVRKRRRHGPCRRQALLALLALGCVLLMLGALHPPPHALPRAPPAPQAAGRSPQAGYRLDFGDPQEWLLESEEEDQEYGRLPPLVSLREDQLLVAVASPRAGRNRSRGGRGGGYRLIPRPQKQQNPAAPERDWAAEEEDEEDGEASEEGERTALSREEAPSARSPPHSGGSRHPLYEHGDGNGTPLQYSCLENPMDGGTWWATVHGVAKSGTRLSDFTFSLS